MTTNYRNETNSLEDTGIDQRATTDEVVGWGDRRLHRVIRIRLLSDPGFPFWDVSYVLGTLKTGEQVRVQVPFYQLPRRAPVREMVKHARRDGVYLAQLCGGDIHSVISKLW